MMPFVTLFEILFISTMASKASENMHSVAVYSPTLEFRSSSKWITDSMLFNCKSTFSVEIPNNAIEIDDFAFSDCFCLRNVAFPPDAVMGYKIFLERDNYSDLQDCLVHKKGLFRAAASI